MEGWGPQTEVSVVGATFCSRKARFDGVKLQSFRSLVPLISDVATMIASQEHTRTDIRWSLASLLRRDCNRASRFRSEPSYLLRQGTSWSLVALQSAETPPLPLHEQYSVQQLRRAYGSSWRAGKPSIDDSRMNPAQHASPTRPLHLMSCSVRTLPDLRASHTWLIRHPVVSTARRLPRGSCGTPLPHPAMPRVLPRRRSRNLAQWLALPNATVLDVSAHSCCRVRPTHVACGV